MRSACAYATRRALHSNCLSKEGEEAAIQNDSSIVKDLHRSMHD